MRGGVLWLAVVCALAAGCGKRSSGSGLANFASPTLSTVRTGFPAAAADGWSPIQLSAQVFGADGQPSVGVGVEFTVTGTNNIIVQPDGPTDEDGIATGSLASLTAESKTVRATLRRGKAIQPLTASATVVFAEPPRVRGPALYLDRNRNGQSDAGDHIILPFTLPVSTAPLADGDDLAFPVFGDTPGSGAQIVAGPAADEVTLVLGPGAQLRTRQAYATGSPGAGSPTGIDIDRDRTLGCITESNGVTAQASIAADLVAGFVAGSTSLGASNSRALAAGDMDGDGDMDLVVANYNQPTRLYRNQGGGQFVDSLIALGGGPTLDVALGDVNRDGKLDVVLANDRQLNQVFLGQGNGTSFATGPTFGDSLGVTQALLLVDVNADGILDAVCGQEQNRSNRIYLGDGNGGFQDVGSALGIGDVRSIVAGDFDGDGDIDLLVGQDNDQPNRIHFNNGQGGFVASNQTLGSLSTQAVAAGDLDGDGDLDLVFGNRGLGVGNQVCWNDGSGGISDSGQSLGNGDTVAVELVDLDRDGDLDLLVANSNRGTEFHRNDGAGYFGEPLQELGSSGARDLVVADLDGDGDLDFATARAGNASNEVFLYSLSGTFGPVRHVDRGDALSPVTVNATDFGDLDRDGELDVVLATVSGVKVHRQQAGALLPPGPTIGTGEARAVLLRDLDRDGKLDLIAVFPADGIQLYRGDGSGGFAASGGLLAAGQEPQHVAAADLDGDGDLDLALALGDTVGLPDRVFWNDGNGGFTDAGQLLGTERSRFVCSADLDGDGDLDLAFATGSPGQPGPDRVYWNDGSGQLTDSGAALGLSVTTQLLAGDLDRDGDLDLLAVHDGEAAQVYWNQLATFASGPTLGSAASGIAATLDDWDGDGDLDVLLAHALSDRLYVNEQGSFSLASTPAGFGPSLFLQSVDLDGDGDRDLLKAGIGSTSRWLRQD